MSRLFLIITVFGMSFFAHSQNMGKDLKYVKGIVHSAIHSVDSANIFTVVENDSVSFCLVKWNDGYMAFGKMVNGKENEVWTVLDRKSRIRKHLFFMGGECCKTWTYDKKERLINESNYSVTF